MKRRIKLFIWKVYYFFFRSLYIHKYLSSHSLKKLQLGCGPNLLSGWLNTDFYPGRKIVPVDITKRFPFKTNTFHYIFSEHVQEHFDYQIGVHILKESHRVLKKGGKIRIATPDLKYIIKLYDKKKSLLQKKYIRWIINTFPLSEKIYDDTFVINNVVRNWGHLFIYDFKTLKKTMSKIGFKKIKEFRPEKSTEKELRNLESHGKVIGREFNELETFVLEAVK